MYNALSKALLAGAILSLCGATVAAENNTRVQGEILDPSNYGEGYIESLEVAIERDRLTTPDTRPRSRQPGDRGVWKVPSRRTTTSPRGMHNAMNKWGDPSMGIGFPAPVHVFGLYVSGQSEPQVWAAGVTVLGFRDGKLVGRSDCVKLDSDRPQWLHIDLHDVDRIQIVADPVVDGAGWYAIDDLTYAFVQKDGLDSTVVVDFEDLPFNHTLTGTGYAGLTWEYGAGDFSMAEAVHAPEIPEHIRRGAEKGAPAQPSGTRATSPTLASSFQGVIRGDAGSESYPPDTHGAIGPGHFVETVNRNFAIYDRVTGVEIANMHLQSFLPGSNGDPRVIYDHYSQRWFVIVSDFDDTARVYLAVSLSSDPTGDWYKTYFATDGGSDSGCWPDYPTLGVDANGIYSASYMVGCGMTIFAINKQPLIAPLPSLGTVTAFRGLPWEGAIQPAVTHGSATGAYLVSTASNSSLRIRRIDPPLTNPSLVEVGFVGVPTFSAPNDAPALGSSTPLDTVGDRLMVSVYRNGSLWTAHTINVSGRAGCRWYEIDPENLTLLQSGTVGDPTLHFYFPSISVNRGNDAVMAFTGSNSTQYASCYYTGRRAEDPAGEMAPPVLYRAGAGAQNNLDGYGRNRWGDYSFTSIDPVDDNTFWTIQAYGHATDIWGTYVAQLTVEPPDCNGNGIPDDIDIAAGTSTDCNDNGKPDECDSLSDCNNNGEYDACELLAGTAFDCNFNGVLDSCDIADGTSDDCQSNGIPDDCEIGSGPTSITFDLGTNPGWTTQGQWGFGQPSGNGGQYGGPDPTSGRTGPNVYGYNLNGDYSANMTETHLTSAPIDCSRMSDVQLSFWRWLGVEQPAYDHAYVRVSNDGTTWATIWENTSEVSDSAWVYQSFDISAVADYQPTVYLRWTMGTTDGAWQYCGWNIDDIEVSGYALGGGENDCNANSIPDDCEIADGLPDCNGNGKPDACDIADGTSEDTNGDGVPDECVGTPGDMNCDGTVDFADINPFVTALSNQTAYEQQFPGCRWLNGDVNDDGTVDFDDINPFVALLSTK